MQKSAEGNMVSGTRNLNGLSAGAFSFQSPPERLLLSDTTNHDPETISPFMSRHTVLKFNSANKSSGNKVICKANKSLSKKSKKSGDSAK